MDRWRAEGGRTMTLYLEAFTAAFWVALAAVTIVVGSVRAWVRRETPMEQAEMLGVGLMLGYAWFLIMLIGMAVAR